MTMASEEDDDDEDAVNSNFAGRGGENLKFFFLQCDFFHWYPPKKVLSTEKLIYARLGVSRAT